MTGVKTDNALLNKTFEFSIEIIQLYKELVKQNEFVLSKQVLRSGTSIGANVEEAMAGHSQRDFLAKLIIANKEARETKYWLRLLDSGKFVNKDFEIYLEKINEILALLTSIIKTMKLKMETVANS